jgi:hypothetical protein
MSFSANNKVKKSSTNFLYKKYIDRKIENYFQTERNTSQKESSHLNLKKINNKNIPTSFSNSSITTNISVTKEKDKEKENSCHYSIKPIIEDRSENKFISKQKILYKSPNILNNKIITFQKQKNKEILEFSLFDDKFIFKDINKSYLQDEHDDDGSESSDEKIKDGRLYLTQELEDSAKELSKIFKKNKDKNILSRRIRFKN